MENGKWKMEKFETYGVEIKDYKILLLNNKMLSKRHEHRRKMVGIAKSVFGEYNTVSISPKWYYVEHDPHKNTIKYKHNAAYIYSHTVKTEVTNRAIAPILDSGSGNILELERGDYISPYSKIVVSIEH